MGESKSKGMHGRNDDQVSDTTPAPGTGTRSRSGGQQSHNQQSSNEQGRNQGGSLGKSLDQDVLGKEN